MIYKGNYNLLENHLFIQENIGINPGLTLVRDVDVWDEEAAAKFNQGFSEMVNWYIHHVDQVEVPKLIKEYLGHILLYASKKVTVDYCGASETYFSFSEDKLIPCNRFKDQDMMISKIPEFRQMNACKSCEVRNFCKKGCLYENIKNEGPILEICDMYKHMYKELQRMTKALSGNNSFKAMMKEAISEC